MLMLMDDAVRSTQKKAVEQADLGGGFTDFLFSPRKLGKIPILTNIFSDGLKPPTSDTVDKHES